MSSADDGKNLLEKGWGFVTRVTNGAIHEVNDNVINPLVHAAEQPLQNIVNDSKVVVGGVYTVFRGVTGLVPYFVGGWLTWTAFQMYFPSEYTGLINSFDRAAKRMRLE